MAADSSVLTSKTNGHVTNGHAPSHGNGRKTEEYIRRAVEKGNPNALRISLYYATCDPDLTSMVVSKQDARGGAMQDYVLSPGDTKIVQDKAVEYLLKQQNNPSSTTTPPTQQECVRLMSIFHGEQLNSKMAQMGYEELAFQKFPRDVSWSAGQPCEDRLSTFHVVIIGAGINGISMAVMLKRLGIQFTLIDRQQDVGGTWMENNYPEARVDTMGFTFQYKFERSTHWREMFPPGNKIRNYLDDVSLRYDVKKNILFGREVVDANWDNLNHVWELTVQHNGTREPLLIRPNVVISAVGLFSTPNLPNIPGINDFQGHMWHTTHWNQDVAWEGKRIAVIGNGSSGAQLIPGLARKASKLGVYQRTPQWMSPYAGYRDNVPGELEYLFENVPFFYNWNNYAGYIRSMQLPPLQVDDPAWRAQGGLVNRRNDKLRASLTKHIIDKVGGPDSPLLPKLLPTYAPLVRRLVVDNGFYDALMRDNVELFADGIDKITEDGIRSKDGRDEPYDIIVLACGFQPTNYLYPVDYHGLDGITLDVTWAKDGARSYLGLTIPGYPNLFTMYGPNHQPRGGPSIHGWSEIWCRYIATCIVAMVENDIQSLDVKQQVYDEYNVRLDAANKKLIWESDGKGYFVNEHGRQAVNLPWDTEDYHAMVLAPNLEDFHIVKGV
ncbi:hypothetical protein SEUCBS139899_002065 [Sporothrix eucalyptigena]|uniref:Uncharacterized protein n=1 Tax=Sporothrix eucalyptigena TaxID=1812306 RepID=A0ABP0BYE4_9PEZI